MKPTTYKNVKFTILSIWLKFPGKQKTGNLTQTLDRNHHPEIIQRMELINEDFKISRINLTNISTK
jgi:hypothetical protein